MKKLILAAILITSFIEVKASHVSGGDLYYKYIGDSTNVPYQYMVTLNLYRRNETGSAGLGSTMTVNVNSTCYAQQNITVQRISSFGHTSTGDGGITPTSPSSCVDITDPNVIRTSLHRYRAVIVLPGKCQDFKFSYSLCCRNTAITNISSSSGGSFIIEALLNNTKQPNSTPNYDRSPLIWGCLGQNIFSRFGGPEKDGDSLHYALTPALTSPSVVAIYNAPLTAVQPISSVNGVSMDSKNGVLTLVPNQVENDLVHVTCTEYRYDSLINTWYQIGETSREIMFIVAANCRKDSLNWVSEYRDSLNPVGALVCGDTIIELNTQIEFLASSLSVDGTDFALLNSQNKLVPIVGARAILRYSGSLDANAFILKLKNPIAYNDTLTLVTKLGNDLNTLVNVCGESLKDGDSLAYVVSGCTTGITLGEQQLLKGFTIYPNPANSTLSISPNNLEEHTDIEIITLQGRVIFKGSYGSGSVTLPVHHLTRGFYLLRVSQQDETRIMKFEKL